MRSARTWLVYVALAAVVAFSFGVRAYFVLRSPQPGVVYDALGYDMSARRLVSQGSFAFPVLLTSLEERPAKAGDRTYLNIPPNAWTVPGYSTFLAAVYAVTGTGPERLVAVRLVQSLLGAATVLLAYLIAARLSNRGGGLLAAVLVAGYPQYVAAAGFIYTEVVYTFLLGAFLLALLLALERRTLGWWVAAGVLFAAGAYVRPIVLLWYFAVAAYLLLGRHFGKREALRDLAVLGGVVVLLFLPWWARNYAVYHRFVPLTTASANPLYAGTTHSFEKGGRATEIYPEALKQAVATNRADETVLNDFWAKEGSRRLMERIRERPLWLLQFRFGRMVETITRWWPTGIPFIDKRPWLADLQGRWHVLLWWLVPVGALAGLRDRRILLLTSLVPYFLVMHAITLPLARYQYPMLFVAAVVGGSGVAVLSGAVRDLLRRERGSESRGNGRPAREVA